MDDTKLLDLPDKLQLNVGLSIPIRRHAEFVAEYLNTWFVGHDTPRLIDNNPSDLNIGMRFFFKNGAISFGGAYRRFLNNEDDITLPVFVSSTTFVPPFFIINPRVFRLRRPPSRGKRRERFCRLFAIAGAESARRLRRQPA